MALVPDRDRSVPVHRRRRRVVQLRRSSTTCSRSRSRSTSRSIRPGTCPSPVRPTRLYLAVYPCLIAGLLLMIQRAQPGAGPHQPAGLAHGGDRRGHRVVGVADLAVHPHRRPRPEDQAHRHGLPGHGPAPRGRGDPPRRRRRPQAGGLLPDDHRHRRALRHRRHLRLVRPVHGVGLPTRKRIARSRLDGLLRAAGHRGAASVDGEHHRQGARMGGPAHVRPARPAHHRRPRSPRGAPRAELARRTGRHERAQRRLDRPVPRSWSCAWPA